MSDAVSNDNSIAIVGMAGRFPKAANLEEFWRNLRDGVEAISTFSEEEGQGPGYAFVSGNANHVKARGILEGADLFDAEFFGMTPREAEVMDPQHRVFLECAWQALEDAGCDPGKFGGSIGVFGGMSMNTYLAYSLASRPDIVGPIGEYQVMLGNDKDFLPTRVSYKLNLKGPSLSIQTACSTSLVAVCVACQHLLNGQCDAALAGGVSVSFPQKKGHIAQEGGIGSPDGHCRAFDARAAGTVRGEGVGIVVLKRLDDAVANGDHIYAVIRGFATNNDGANKIGYTAPSVDGQAEVIAAAQALAGVSPSSISYVEAHGTATPLGDPIEVAGLAKAFNGSHTAEQFCALGSVKTNIGHLDAAAGIAGLIKTALALHHKKIPPSLHFESPNPKIDFSSGPFRVNTALTDWSRGASPRRAGVSSFGIGGTNAHVVLEEAPVSCVSRDARDFELFAVSARTPKALDRITENLGQYLKAHPEQCVADVAATLQLGRHDFSQRRVAICQATNAGASLEASRIFTAVCERENTPVAFLFPGQGAQRPNMARQLYKEEAAFRDALDQCVDILKPELGLDLRTVIFPDDGTVEQAASRLMQTELAQPALFAIEYALAKLWMSWGIKPAAMIGHSIGEYVAACLAGVFSLEAALKLVAARGRLMQRMPTGRMLAVRLPEPELLPMLDSQLSLAAVNAPALCVVSGPVEAVREFQGRLQAREIGCVELQTSHAFHSAMMDPIISEFEALVRETKRSAPHIPFISNVTGNWITEEQAIEASYWAAHLRNTVRFVDGLHTLSATAPALLEVGPGQALATMARQAGQKFASVVSSLPGREELPEFSSILECLGKLWLAGVAVDWHAFHARECRQRVPLPTYPFERKRYFIEPAMPGRAKGSSTDFLPVAESKPGKASVESISSEAHVRTQLKAVLRDLSGLDLDDMTGGTTFTELGFDSLFLTQVSLAVEKKFGVHVAFRHLLEECNTLDALAGRIMAPSAGAAIAPAVPVSKADVPIQSGVMPLTDAQRDMWFAHHASREASCVYNECRLVHLRGALNFDALGQAAQKLVERHEALRAVISPTGDSQRIQETLAVQVARTDWSASGQVEQAGSWDLAQRSDSCEPFDLERGPLVRFKLFSFSEGRHVLMLTVHHIICDGHSLGTLVRELGEMYSAACAGRPGALAPCAQFSDYVRGQSQYDRRATGEAFWLRQLQDVSPGTELPADNLARGGWSYEGATAGRYLGAPLVQELKSLCARQGCTLFTLLLAGYATLLRRLSGRREMVVGVPVADRGQNGREGLVGHCIHFMPLCIRLPDEMPFAEYIVALQKAFWEAYEHGRYPFGTLVQKLNVPRDHGRMPLAGATFNFERSGTGLDFSGLDASVSGSRYGYTSFDLNFNTSDVNGELHIDCRYNTSLFSAASIRRWLGHYQTLLEAVVADPQQRVWEVPILTPAERAHILNPGGTASGRPNAAAWILDEHEQLVPMGVKGRLYTARESSSHDVGAAPAGSAPKNLLNTDKIARRLPDGSIEVVGRADQRVRFRGATVDLGEISGVLCLNAGVREAEVVLRSPTAGAELVAYVALAGGSAETIDGLRDFLAKRLPEYIVPQSFVLLDKLPRTAEGNVDAAALPAPVAVTRESADTFAAPRTPAEKALAQIWRTLLRTEVVGVHDDFFELGGHSLLIMQVLTRIREMFQLEISIHQFFDSPTVAGLAAIIESTAPKASGDKAQVLQAVI